MENYQIKDYTVNKNTKGITYEKVVEILKNYNRVKDRVLLLEYEINNYTPIVSGDDVIYQMTFNGLSNQDNLHYDTEQIAMSYEKKADRINIRHKQELEDEVCLLKAGNERLNYYIGFLTERQAKIIRLIYFEGKTITEVSLSMSLSETTVKTTRRSGINRLLEMYSIISC